MRRHTITLSLALGLIASLVLSAGIAARPIDPSPGTPVATGAAAPCPITSASATVVPGGVYRAMVDELRQQGYSRTEIQAEIGSALVVLDSGTRPSNAQRCTQQP